MPKARPDLIKVSLKLPKELDRRIEYAVADGIDQNKSVLVSKAIEEYLNNRRAEVQAA